MTASGDYPRQHDSLPETLEPAENPFLSGHESEAASLLRDYREGKLHHAIILSGPAGIGKATLAFHFARQVLSHPDPATVAEQLPVPAEVEGQAFRLVAQGAHPSLLHLTRPPADRGKGFKSVLTVDEIRRVNRFLSMTAHDGGHRIVIVDPADDMNVNAANALLKNLEEPPARCLFLLVTHSPGRLLATIRSRCGMVRLRPLGEADMARTLDAVGCELPKDNAARKLLFGRSAGSVRRAIMLARFGGLDILAGLDDLLDAACFQTATAYRLADALAARDDAIRFGLFNEAVLAKISDLAREAAAAGRVAAAARLSALWQSASDAMADVRIYNLDRRQHVVGLMRRLHEAAAI